MSNTAGDESSAVNVMEEFRAGVTATLRSWSALRAAVESGWGGVDSQSKAEELRDSIYEVMDGSCFPPKIDAIDLEDNLAIYMEEEFSVVLEDGSEKQVADFLFQMYEACSRGDVSLARQAVESAKRAELAATAYPIKVQNPELDEGSDDEDDVMETNDDEDDADNIDSSTVAQAYAAGSLFGPPKKIPTGPPKPVRQLGEAPPELPPRVEADEDGFAPVVTKRRNRK